MAKRNADSRLCERSVVPWGQCAESSERGKEAFGFVRRLTQIHADLVSRSVPFESAFICVNLRITQIPIIPKILG